MNINTAKKIMKIANELDAAGSSKFADRIDLIIKESMEEGGLTDEGLKTVDNVFQDDGDQVLIFLQEAKRIRTEFLKYAIEEGMASESFSEDEVIMSVAGKGDYGYEDAVAKGNYVVIYCAI